MRQTSHPFINEATEKPKSIKEIKKTNNILKKQMSLITHARKELKLAGLFKKDSDYEGATAKAVMELVRLFSSQDHSGASAKLVINLFEKVASYKTLTPISGKDEEWNDMCDKEMQNNREGCLFKNKETGECTYLDAIIWRTQTGSTWCGSAIKKDGTKVTSRQIVKSFPFNPKTFYVDVIEKEVSKNNWDFNIKDESQLDAVAEYYKM